MSEEHHGGLVCQYYTGPIYDYSITQRDRPGEWELIATSGLQSWFGTDTEAGVTVTVPKSLCLPAVWQAVSMISGDVARMPLNVYERMDDDSRRKATEHPVNTLCCKLTYQRERLSAYKFWRRLMAQALLWNNGYAYIVPDGMGRPIGMIPMLSDRTRLDRVDGRLIYVSEIISTAGKHELVVLQPEEVLHIEGPSIDGQGGHRFLDAAREAFGRALAATGFASQFFKRGGRIGGILEIPRAMPKQAKDTQEEGFRQAYERADAAFRTVILRDGAKFHAGQISPRETQLVESRQEDIRDVARMFALHPSKLGDDQTTSYNSKAEDNRDYLDRTLTHWLVAIASEVNIKLLGDSYLADDFYCEHNTDALMWMNTAERFASYGVAIQNRIMSPNEARLKENMPRYDGGDAFENPNTSSGPSNEDRSPADQESIESSHRTLFERTLAATLKVLGGKVSRNAATRAKLAAYLNNRFGEHLRLVVQEAVPIVEAYAAASGLQLRAAGAYLFGQIHSDIEQLAELADKDAVQEWFDRYVAEAPTRLARLFFKG